MFEDMLRRSIPQYQEMREAVKARNDIVAQGRKAKAEAEKLRKREDEALKKFEELTKRSAELVKLQKDRVGIEQKAAKDLVAAAGDLSDAAGDLKGGGGIPGVGVIGDEGAGGGDITLPPVAGTTGGAEDRKVSLMPSPAEIAAAKQFAGDFGRASGLNLEKTQGKVLDTLNGFFVNQ